MFEPREIERLSQAAGLLRRAEKSVRILRRIAWPQEVALEFFAAGARELPRVAYLPLDPGPVLAEVRGARDLVVGSSPVHAWLLRVAGAIETGARMLAAVGQREFFDRSCELYGYPTQKIADGNMCSLDLAIHLDETLDGFSDLELIADLPARQDADTVAGVMRRICADKFGDRAPEVEVVDELSANALAGARYIRLRRGASFSDRDVFQLVHHEAFVHIATTLNGVDQTAFPILAAGHPGTTRTQEGLAVFAEFISGSMDPDRLRRLADRVIAIEMAIDGADFLDVFRFFLDNTRSEAQAFENARRVFRGGVLTGGAPFTKDGVYIEGLLRVHNFLRSVVQFSRTDLLHLLFCGKLDIEDLPAMAELAGAGLAQFPRFLPPWVADLRFLVSYLAYSGFLNRVDLTKIRSHYAELLGHAPVASERASDATRAPTVELRLPRDPIAVRQGAGELDPATGWPGTWGREE